MNVSVVICCYNSSSRIEPTLRHLANQEGLKNDDLEVVLVDNNSSDNTKFVAKEIWREIKAEFSLKVVNEKKSGLTYARHTGVNEANNEIIIFCDDDNWLDRKYVFNVKKLLENDKIGLIGGKGIPVFEDIKPEWFDEYGRYFAVGEQGAGIENIDNKKGCIYGAGMAFRKEVWKDLFKSGFKPVLSDRKGKKLSSGGDTEISYALRMMGYELWYCHDLTFKHFMTKDRMNKKYLVKLLKSMSISNYLLQPYLKILQKSELQPISKRDIFYLLRKFIAETIKNDQRLALNTKVKLLYSKKYNSILREIISWQKIINKKSRNLTNK